MATLVADPEIKSTSFGMVTFCATATVTPENEGPTIAGTPTVSTRCEAAAWGSWASSHAISTIGRGRASASPGAAGSPLLASSTSSIASSTPSSVERPVDSLSPESGPSSPR